MIKIFATVAAAIGLVFTTAACAPQTIDMTSVTAVIDVRTPEEFAGGHVDGAINIDWQGSTFTDEVTALDPTGTYVLYCRSGNRAEQARVAMVEMGFASVTNLGSVENASGVTGLPIVP